MWMSEGNGTDLERTESGDGAGAVSDSGRAAGASGVGLRISVGGGGDGADNDDTPGPSERLAAVSPDVALPAAVVNFPDGGQHTRARIAISRQDRGDPAIF